MNNLKLFSYGMFIVMMSIVSFNQLGELLVNMKTGYRLQPVQCHISWSGAGDNLPVKERSAEFDASKYYKIGE